ELTIQCAADVVDRRGNLTHAGIEGQVGGRRNEAQVVEPVAGETRGGSTTVAERRAGAKEAFLARRLIERIGANRDRAEHALVAPANTNLVVPARPVRAGGNGITVREASRRAGREAVTHAGCVLHTEIEAEELRRQVDDLGVAV